MDSEDNLLVSHQVRTVYLITYSQADRERFPGRENFVAAVLDAFSRCDINVIQWVCSQENHNASPGIHYHMAVKLSERRRWVRVRNMLQVHQNVNVNFSNRHDNYYSAWRYTTKEDTEYIQSPNHPDLSTVGPPQTTQATTSRRRQARERTSVRGSAQKKRKRLLSVYEVSQIAVTKNITNRLELLAFAQEQKSHGKTDLAEFIANRGSKAVDEAIKVGWELKTAPGRLQRSKQTRLERLRAALEGECVPNCNRIWLQLAQTILVHNNINKAEFVGAVRLLLDQGRGKYRNIILTGPSNCGKTFLLNPLNVVYNTFCNPATASFAWVGVEDCEVILLNDFRWSPQVIPWHNLLLLLEGQLVRFPAPKTHYAKDIVFDTDAPIFCTSSEELSFVRGGVLDRVETDMMNSRWKSFKLTYQIPEDNQVNTHPCSRCFAELILH